MLKDAGTSPTLGRAESALSVLSLPGGNPQRARVWLSLGAVRSPRPDRQVDAVA
jgi:hypothetical protein